MAEDAKTPESNDLKDYDHRDLLFPGKYLKGADLRGKKVSVTIARIEPRHKMESKGRGKKTKVEYKPVMFFAGKEKGMKLNGTNHDRIAEYHGDTPSGWIGKQIPLYTEKVDAFGRIWDAIRVVPKGK